MRKTEVIIANAQMQLPFKPIIFFGISHCLAGEPTIVLTKGIILPFHIRSVDGMAYRRALQVFLQSFFGAENQFSLNLDHFPFSAVFDYLGIDQIRTRLQTWLARSASLARADEYPPASKMFQNCFLILRPLVAEENVQGAIIDSFGLSNQFISFLLRYIAYNKGSYDSMLRDKAYPNPTVAIFALELFQGLKMRPFFFTKLQNSSSCASSKCILTIR